MTRITMEQADELITTSKYDERIDDHFEVTPDGYAYGLDDGSVALVTFTGEIVHITDEATQSVCERHDNELVGWEEVWCPLCP